MCINNLVVDLNPQVDPERDITKTTEQSECHDSDDSEAYKLIGTDMSSISQTTICRHVIEKATDKGFKETKREINFDLGNEVKRQIKDITGLNFKTVTQPLGDVSLELESSVTIVQNQSIKSQFKIQSDSVQRKYYRGGEERIRARLHKKPPYILFPFVFREIRIQLVSSIIQTSSKCSFLGKVRN
ncbi:unnamed protein product [Brachionus calyciflorus]|uniref:Uncharacterized protein n=1 Tax=Brachionus calyciflorus TaxID=104777 RepID=A0A814CCX9_9BILA|nr:unnamed protein product [Brachionus calyciflorus]